MMATNNREEHGGRPAAADAIDASLIVATRRGDCQKLKDPIIQKDATAMVVVSASENQQASEEKKSSPAIMHPLLAAAACRGNLGELKFLLNRGPLPPQFRGQLEAYCPGYSHNRSLAMQLTATNIEEGMNASSILEGVTVEGDTALHLLAAHGHGDNLMDCASLIYGEDKSSLYKQNNNGDTPLHCAARTGKSQMVSHLIDLARVQNRVEDLLRKENISKETALHEAVRIRNNHIVKELLKADPELARFPEEGPSPLYLAILQGEKDIAETLHDESKDNVLSYAGPDGQNALHAAIQRKPGEMVDMLLNWNKGLTSEVDCNGNTPLHFRRVRVVFWQNPAALYQPDNGGMFPIHVAASAGSVDVITAFIEYHPSSASLRDRRGRTFLHIAAEKSKWKIVKFACQAPSLAWILNMQDTDGNTALHLAVQTGCLRSFSYLLGNPQVHLNLVNKKGQTPRGIARSKLPLGIGFYENPEYVIEEALSRCGADKSGISRVDHFIETRTRTLDYQRKEMENLKDSTQTLCIGSVLMTTMAFGAIFAVPGGYRGDDHPNGGTPTLAGRYTFDAFMMANALTFICSSVATLCLMISGLPFVDLKNRSAYFLSSTFFVKSSVTSLSAAFALGVYMVLAPVAHKTAVAICVMSPLVVTCTFINGCLKWALLARPLFRRIHPTTLMKLTIMWIAGGLLEQCWPLLITFIWPTIARNH